MNERTPLPALIGLCIAGFGISAVVQGEHGERGAQEERETASRDADIEVLHALVRQARADLEALREEAGIRRETTEGRREHREGRREGRGEHGERGHEGRSDEGVEEGGTRVAKNARWDATRRGARLILAYDEATQSFEGIVHNTTSKTLSGVRVEVHLSNGVELGPTKRTDLEPGGRIPVELSAAGQEFSGWTAHPEHGSEEGHGPEEGEGRGEHVERDENRPKDPALRPLHDQLLLLRQEIREVARGLRDRRR